MVELTDAVEPGSQRNFSDGHFRPLNQDLGAVESIEPADFDGRHAQVLNKKTSQLPCPDSNAFCQPLNASITESALTDQP
jgi:hypothetical protein